MILRTVVLLKLNDTTMLFVNKVKKKSPKTEICFETVVTFW